MQTIRISTAQNIDIDFEIAGLGERLVARLIDYAIFFFIMILGVVIMSYTHYNSTRNGILYGVIIVVYFILFVFYDLLCEIFMHGQSIGKRIMKIKVISLDGSQPTIGQYLLRWLFRLIDFGITGVAGLICAAVTEKCQRIGDLVAGTTLIKTQPRTKLGHVAFMPEEPEEYQATFPEAGQLNDNDMQLIQEVINTYIKTRNSVVVYNMALKIKTHLHITPPADMNDMLFLQTIMKDYSHVVKQSAML